MDKLVSPWFQLKLEIDEIYFKILSGEEIKKHVSRLHKLESQKSIQKVDKRRQGCLGSLVGDRWWMFDAIRLSDVGGGLLENGIIGSVTVLVWLPSL